MFEIFKKKSLTDKLAEFLARTACEENITESERAAVISAGIDPDIYRLELMCFKMFSVMYGYYIWEGVERISKEQAKEMYEKYQNLILNHCKKISPKPLDLYSHINARFDEYYRTQLIDIDRQESGILSAELPRKFVDNIQTKAGEIPFEFMPNASEMFNHYANGIGKHLTSLRLV